jgi:putative transposase
LTSGLHTLAVCSDGTRIPNPRHLVHHAQRLRVLERRVARREAARGVSALLPAIERHARLPETRGALPPFPELVLPPKSRRQLRAEADLAREHRKIADARQTTGQQAVARLVPEHRVIGLEDLATANLLRNHHLARSIADAGWRAFRQALETRAEDRGSLLICADRFFASSQTCADCGARNPAVRDLGLPVLWRAPRLGP